VEEQRRNGDIQIEILTERVNNWMETTTSYRRELCSKNDRIISEIADIKQTLATLPCPQRIEQTKSIHKDIGWLQKIVYTILCYSIPSLIGLAVAWGALNKDVSNIKETSYGYRGIKVVTDGKSDRV
jgi:hypothetical protein